MVGFWWEGQCEQRLRGRTVWVWVGRNGWFSLQGYWSRGWETGLSFDPEGLWICQYNFCKNIFEKNDFIHLFLSLFSTIKKKNKKHLLSARYYYEGKAVNWIKATSLVCVCVCVFHPWMKLCQCFSSSSKLFCCHSILDSSLDSKGDL